MPIIEFIAKRLRELRRVHGLTQEQVATLLGTDSRWYQRIEQKEKDIRASTIDRLASVFGVTFSEFLSEEMPTTKVRTTPTAPHKPRKSGARKSEKRK